MASVDDRIVRMEFDNAAFEKKIQSTIASLAELNKAMKMTEATKGLTDVNAAAQKMDLAPMHQGVDGLSAKFIALSTIAITALSKITSKAMEVGSQLVKSLTLDQVSAGFAEYELKLNSIQTIMAGSGESLEVVNQKLSELNEYSDRTIYSFRDMTTNIGKFTNAGVKLDMAVESIQGIANVAAVSGANAEEASRAMYNFAQALSKGHVALIDWKSIEMANMGTKEFKQQLIDAAAATGSLTKRGNEYVTSAGKVVTATKGFNESLTDQWLTTEVLNNTLGDYADETTAIGKKAFASAQDIKTFTQLLQTVKESIGSGWAQTFEIIIGSLDEAKALFSEIGGAISKFVQASSDARNELLGGWKFLGGRALLIDSLRRAFQNLGAIFKPIKEAFREIFPRTTSMQLVGMTQAFSNFVDKLKPSQQTVENLKSIFKGFFGILEIGWTIIKEGTKFVFTLFDIFAQASTGPVLDLGARFAEFAIKLNEVMVEGGAIKTFFEGMSDAARTAAKFIGELISVVTGLFTGTADTGDLKKSVDGLTSSAKGLNTVGKDISEFFHNLKESFNEFIDGFRNGIEETGDLAGSLGEGISQALESENFQKVLNVFQTGILGGFMLAFRKLVKDGLKLNLFNGLQGPLNQLTQTLKAMQTQIKVNSLLRIAIAVGILAASLYVLSTIEPAKLATALGGLTASFVLLVGSLAAITKITAKSGVFDGAKFVLMSVGLLILAGAILLLAVAVKKLGSMDMKTLGVGLGAVLVILGEFILMAKMIGQYQADLFKAGLGILAIAGAILILSFAMSRIGDMPLSTIGTSLLTIGASLWIFVKAMNKVSDSFDPKTGTAILAISAAMLILSFAFSKFADLSLGNIAASLVTIAGALAIFIGAMKLMPKDMQKIGFNMILISTSMVILAKAMQMLAGIEFKVLMGSLFGLGIALLAMAVAANAMKDAQAGAASILIISASFLVLAQVLKIIGQLSIGQIAAGLVTIVLALAVFAGAAILLEPILPLMIGLGAALVIAGAAMLLFGAGAYLAVKAFTMLTKTGTTGAKTFAEMLKVIGDALPYLIKQFAEGIIDLIDLLAQAAPEIAANIVEIFAAMLKEFQGLIPLVGTLFSLLLEEIIRIVGTYIPKIVALGLSLILNLLLGIRAALPMIVAIVADIIITFLNQLNFYLPQIIKAGTDLIIAMINGIGKAHIRIAIAIGTLITVFLNALRTQIARVITAGTNLVISLVTGIANAASRIITAGVNTILAFLRGIGQNALKLANGAAEVLIDFLVGLEKAIRIQGPRIRKAGWNVVDALIDGMVAGVGDLGGAAVDAMTDLAGSMVDGAKSFFGIDSPSKVFATIGGQLVDGLSVGVNKGAPELSRTMVKMAETTMDSYTESMKLAVASLEGMTDLNPVITPVLDLSLIERDASKLSGLVDTSNTLTPNVSLSQATTIANSALKRTAPTETPVSTPGEVKFEQNIYAPEQLSTSDIYKQTRNQITIAKEELSIR